MRPRTGQGRIRSSAFLSPPISGTPQVGETLTADTSGIADEDGLDNAAFTYQWLADDADISGATGSTYTLVEADEGKTVNLRVSFTDDGGNDETLTSAATDAVAAPEPPAKPTGLCAPPCAWPHAPRPRDGCRVMPQRGIAFGNVNSAVTRKPNRS